MQVKAGRASGSKASPGISRRDFMAAYRRAAKLPPLNIDPRIDLTSPIYEQAIRLMERDKTEDRKTSKRKRHPKAA
jgi:hypothetical protein